MKDTDDGRWPGNGPHHADITRILNDAASTRDGLDQVFGAVYAELKPVARRLLASSHGGTFSPTVLVHEAYAKLIGGAALNLEGRRHFFALCARTMRQIVVDHARARSADKRGGGRAAVSLDEEGVIDLARPESVLALDEALAWLSERDERLVQLIDLRVYAGLELSEIASLLEVGERQLQRDWQRGRAWLTEALLGNSD